jgi:hypothetical protein
VAATSGGSKTAPSSFARWAALGPKGRGPTSRAGTAHSGSVSAAANGACSKCGHASRTPLGGAATEACTHVGCRPPGLLLHAGVAEGPHGRRTRRNLDPRPPGANADLRRLERSEPPSSCAWRTVAEARPRPRSPHSRLHHRRPRGGAARTSPSRRHRGATAASRGRLHGGGRHARRPGTWARRRRPPLAVARASPSVSTWSLIGLSPPGAKSLVPIKFFSSHLVKLTVS